MPVCGFSLAEISSTECKTKFVKLPVMGNCRYSHFLTLIGVVKQTIFTHSTPLSTVMSLTTHRTVTQNQGCETVAGASLPLGLRDKWLQAEKPRRACFVSDLGFNMLLPTIWDAKLKCLLDHMPLNHPY